MPGAPSEPSGAFALQTAANSGASSSGPLEEIARPAVVNAQPHSISSSLVENALNDFVSPPQTSSTSSTGVPVDVATNVVAFPVLQQPRTQTGGAKRKFPTPLPEENAISAIASPLLANSSTAQEHKSKPAEVLHLAQHEPPSNTSSYGIDAILEELGFVVTSHDISAGNQQEDENVGAFAPRRSFESSTIAHAMDEFFNVELCSNGQQDVAPASVEPEDDLAKQLRDEAVVKRKMQLAVSIFSVHTEKHPPRKPENDLLLEVAAQIARQYLRAIVTMPADSLTPDVSTVDRDSGRQIPPASCAFKGSCPQSAIALFNCRFLLCRCMIG